MNAALPQSPTLRQARAILKRIADRSPESMDDCDQLDALCQAFLASGPDPEFPDLTPSEYRMVEALKRRLGQVITHEMLLNAIYFDKPGGAEGSDRDNTMKQFLKRVKRKLEGRYAITCVWGVGYRMVRA